MFRVRRIDRPPDVTSHEFDKQLYPPIERWIEGSGQTEQAPTRAGALNVGLVVRYGTRSGVRR
jgi:hypothetical protein